MADAPRFLVLLRTQQASAGSASQSPTPSHPALGPVSALPSSSWPSRPTQNVGAGVRVRVDDRPRVLIVEDHDDTRELYAWCMVAAGWYVQAVADGEEALLIAPMFEPDAIILDLHLPVVGGLEVLRALRSSDPLRQVPIVVCTGHLHLLGDDDERAAGFDALVTKPCNPEALCRIVEKLVVASPGMPGS